MSENILIENNTVNITGKVVGEKKFNHEVYGEAFYSFSVEIVRLSEAADRIPVMISERLLEDGLVEEGKYVNVKGQLRSYNSFDNQKTRLVLTVFARDIEAVDVSELEELPNQIVLNGFVCREPIYRKTPFGREIADILLAVNRSYNKSDYIPCITWGRNARYAGKLSVGDNIKIWGRMQSRVYQKVLEDGTEISRVAYEVSVSKFEVCNKKSRLDEGRQETVQDGEVAQNSEKQNEENPTI